jgi:hypothetical protein
MPSLADHQSAEYTKLILMGDSGAGKTSALHSLVPDYDLRILDLDNGLDPLVKNIKRLHPDRLDSVGFVSVRDDYKMTDLGPSITSPKAYVMATKLIKKWEDDTDPAEWGPKKILVVDTLTFLSDSAHAWARGMNPAAKEPRTWFYAAQQSIEAFLAYICSPNFKTNVIVISHISYVTRPDGSMKGYPSSVGKALGPTIPTYFNTVALCQTSGTGDSVKREVRFAPTSLIDLKNPAALDMAKELPLDKGLAELFQKVRA